MPPIKSFYRQRYIESEDGSATVEAVLWLPIFLFGFALVFDATVLFFAEGEATRAVQEANRLASIGRLKSTSETEDHVEAALADLSASAKAVSSINSQGVITTTLTVPAGDLAMLRIFPQLSAVEISVSASQMMEDFT